MAISNVAQSAKDDIAIVPLQHHHFELPVDCKDDAEIFPASPHDRDIKPKARGLMQLDPLLQRFCDFATLTRSEISSKILIRCVTWH